MAKKSRLVNVISVTAIISMAVSTAAMLIILSVMNGMNQFITERYSGFDPDFKVELKKGRFFTADTLKIAEIKALEGVAYCVEVAEEQVLLEYAGENRIVKLKGVGEDFSKVVDIDASIIGGEFDVSKSSRRGICGLSVGSGIFHMMDLPFQSTTDFLELHLVGANSMGSINVISAVSSYPAYVSSVFYAIPSLNDNYIIAPITFLRGALMDENILTSLEIGMKDGLGKRKILETQQAIYNIVNISKAGVEPIGEAAKFSVKNKFEQQESFFKTMKAEKLVVILIFTFVLLISIFTLVASLMLLMYEKRRDIAILSALGMKDRELKKIFLAEGCLISIFGCIIGLILGLLITLGQKNFEWVKLGGGNVSEGTYSINAYPVDLQFNDLIIVTLLVLGVGFLASILPTRGINSNYKTFNQ